MQKLVALTALALTLAAGSVHAAVQTIKAEVNGMVCAFCAQGIEKNLRSLSQTKDVFVDLKNKIVAVELKDGQTLTHDKVKDLIKDAGYDVARIETVAQTAGEIKAGARAKK
jgi:copper chaperone CopZ